LQQLIDKVERYLLSVTGITDVIIAYSGGVDSHVLLDVCSKLQSSFDAVSFKAIYINHGLHQDSEQWQLHCQDVSLALSVDFIAESVDASDVNGEGPEQAARHARYAALRVHCSESSLLLTAQHQDDQAETLMLQLLRGAGVKGLASMPKLAPFGRGFIGRPLLELSQQDILDYANLHELSWVEDSSNLELAYDRNFLRQRVIPVIKQRWPAFSKTTSRTASHCAEASSILDDVASSLLTDNDSAEFSVASMAGQTDKVKRLVLRQWLANSGVRMPSEKVLDQLLMLLALTTRKPAFVAWADNQVRLYNGRLYLTPQLCDGLLAKKTTWQAEQVELSGVLGVLAKKRVSSGGIAERYWLESRISVRRRVGGESIQLPGRLGRKKLKKLYNEAKILPWVRNDVPLIYLDDELVAVADLWLDDRYSAQEGERLFCIDWSHAEFRIR